MAKPFLNTERARVPRTAFRLNSERRLTCDLFYLYPILVEEVNANESWTISNEMVIRMMPMVAPIMHDIHAYVHYYFVPNRLMWEDWEKFHTKSFDGKFTTLPPLFMGSIDKSIGDSVDYREETLFDHLYSFITKPGYYSERPTAFPHRAYNAIWWHYYADENLVNKDDMERAIKWDPAILDRYLEEV